MKKSERVEKDKTPILKKHSHKRDKPNRRRPSESSLSGIKPKAGTESSENEGRQKKLGKFASLD